MYILTWQDDVEPVYERVHSRLLHGRQSPAPRLTPPLKKAIPQLRGPLFSLKPLSERTPTDSEYDVG